MVNREGMLTASEAAAILGQSASNMTNIRKRGHIPGAVRGNGPPGQARAYLYPESEVRAYAEKMQGNGGRAPRETRHTEVSLVDQYEAKLSFAFRKTLEDFEKDIRRKVAEEIRGR